MAQTKLVFNSPVDNKTVVCYSLTQVNGIMTFKYVMPKGEYKYKSGGVYLLNKYIKVRCVGSHIYDKRNTILVFEAINTNPFEYNVIMKSIARAIDFCYIRRNINDKFYC